MERSQEKQRSLRFFSEKNNAMLTVHSREAREYARRLESNVEVAGYDVCVPLEQERLRVVAPVDIRKDYFSGEWFLDFLVYFKDGSSGAREIVRRDKLIKRAVVEQLELSRRYWAMTGMHDWKLVIFGEEEANVF